MNSFPFLASLQVLTVAAWISSHNLQIMKPASEISYSRVCRTSFSRKATTFDHKFGKSLTRSSFNLKGHPAAPVEQIDTVQMSALTKLCELANETALAGWQFSQADPTNGRDRDGCIKFF